MMFNLPPEFQNPNIFVELENFVCVEGGVGELLGSETICAELTVYGELQLVVILFHSPLPNLLVPFLPSF